MSKFETLYRVTDDRTQLNAEELNKRFRSLDDRLRELEAVKLDLMTLLAELRAEGVTRLTDSLQAELPGILADALSGYLTGLADEAVPWEKVNKSGAEPADIGAEVAGAVAQHLATPNAHGINGVAGLAAALANKLDYSARLQAIAEEAPTDGGLIVGTGDSYQVEELIAGDSISITRSDGQLRIDATGSASGESNSGANVGNGVGLYVGKVGTELQFKSLVSLSDALTLADNTAELSLGLDATRLSIPMSGVQNLDAALADKQAHADSLDSISLLPLTTNTLMRGADGAAEEVQLVGQNGISISHQAGEIRIGVSGVGEANTLGSVGAGTTLHAAKDGTTLRLKSLVSLSDAIGISSDNSTVRFDIDPDQLNFSADAIDWASVNKSGASPADIGAVAADTMTAHLNDSDAHGIEDITGLAAALSGCVRLNASTTQTLDAAIAIQQATLSGTSPTPDAANNNYFELTMTGNTTIQTPVNLPSGKLQIFTFVISTNSGAGYSLNWGSAYQWGDQGEPTWATNSANLIVVSFLHRSGNLYYLGHQGY